MIFRVFDSSGSTSSGALGPSYQSRGPLGQGLAGVVQLTDGQNDGVDDVIRRRSNSRGSG